MLFFLHCLTMHRVVCPHNKNIKDFITATLFGSLIVCTQPLAADEWQIFRSDEGNVPTFPNRKMKRMTFTTGWVNVDLHGSRVHRYSVGYLLAENETPSIQSRGSITCGHGGTGRRARFRF